MSGLFPRFQAALRNFAATQLAASKIGKAIANLALRVHRDERSTGTRRPRSSQAPTSSDVNRAAAAAARAAAQVRQDRQDKKAADAAAQAEQFRDEVLKKVTKAAGTAADVVEALLRPKGRPLADLEKELAAAAKLLRQFGYSVKAPGSDRQPSQSPPRPVGPSKKPPQRFDNPEPIQKTKPESSVYFDEAGPDLGVYHVGGRRYNFSPSDPIITGEMIRVTSSNVHSIGYIWNHDNPMKGTLKVRFLGTNRSTSPQTRGGKGPEYHYFGVHPAVFESFRIASSKGKFVWDRLRVRGTVSGHQFPYELTKLQSSGYVPRAATRIGGDEHFIRRTVKGKNGKTYISELQNEFVRRVGMNNPPPGVIAGRGAPNRGTPNRGGPNRGTPKRGRK